MYRVNFLMGGNLYWFTVDEENYDKEKLILYYNKIITYFKIYLTEAIWQIGIL